MTYSAQVRLLSRNRTSLVMVLEIVILAPTSKDVLVTVAAQFKNLPPSIQVDL